jgi:hypothetical protein
MRAWGGSSGAGLRAVHHQRAACWTLVALVAWLDVDSRREGGGDRGLALGGGVGSRSRSEVKQESVALGTIFGGV